MTIILSADPSQSATATTGTGDSSALRSGSRSFWAALRLYLGVGCGLGWDQAWHATHPFRSFFSPPHLFTYSMVFLTALAVARLAVVPRLRVWFGPGFRVAGVPWVFPAAVALTSAGLVLVTAAGFCDLIWHSRLGLDETGWSFPHEMLGWGLTVTLLGFVAGRLALGHHKPVAWYTLLVLGCFLVPPSANALPAPSGATMYPSYWSARQPSASWCTRHPSSTLCASISPGI